MKLVIVLSALLMSQMTFAQTVKAKKLKTEMIERTDLLIGKIESARLSLEKEDVIAACATIKEAFALYPKHVEAIGGHMDIEKGRSIRARDEALTQLIQIHRIVLNCDQGKDCENIDAKKVRKTLKETASTLNKQKSIIQRTDTDKNNYFKYEYSF